MKCPTIDGRTLLKIPPGTQSGQKLRLREKGVPSATKEGARGDEIVEVKLTVPMPRDERSKEILRELAKLNPEDPRAELWKKSEEAVVSSHPSRQMRQREPELRIRLTPTALDDLSDSRRLDNPRRYHRVPAPTQKIFEKLFLHCI